jgi:hypothetical protein
MYTIRALPKDVDFKEIKWIEKGTGDDGDNIFAIFKCKSYCKTIFTYPAILEMNNFA